MADKYNLGAINTKTRRYVLPNNANKEDIYECTGCEQRVIFRRGTIRKAHFSHYSPTNTCTYYEHPNESQQHKDAKYKLCERLNNKFPISFSNDCPECSVWPAGLGDLDIEYKEGDSALVEYRDPANKYIADVALLNNGEVRYIFEIKHTHLTTNFTRPEPWFEITTAAIFEAEELLKNPDSDNYLGDKYELSCIRGYKNRLCDNCRICKEDWVQYLPRLTKKYGIERKWKQDKPCIKCKRETYNPVFAKGYFQICKICICEEEETLKGEFTKLSGKCLFVDD